MVEVPISLYGGEQDGYRTCIDLRGKTPDMFYIWRAADNDKIVAAKGKQRMVLADRLSVLAYRFDTTFAPVGDGPELRYIRHAEADKVLAPDAL